MKKLIICGYPRCGKDTVAQLISEIYNYKFTSTSMILVDKVIYPAMQHLYDNKEECYNDRVNNRHYWAELLYKYNKSNPTRFMREVFKENDIYCGLRSRRELLSAMRNNLVDISIWVDSAKRVNKHDDAINIYPYDCDIIIDNNGDKEDLIKNLNILNGVLYEAD
jgi:hypothetical protein